MQYPLVLIGITVYEHVDETYQVHLCLHQGKSVLYVEFDSVC